MQFVNGEKAAFDKIVYCTGYKIDLPYLSEDVRAKALDEGSNAINVCDVDLTFRNLVIWGYVGLVWDTPRWCIM